MKTLWWSLTALVSLSAVAMAGESRALLRYDPSNEVAIRGTVVEVRNLTRPGLPHGTYLVVKTLTETLNVHLGSRGWGARGRTSFTAGEPVEVVGCLAGRGGSPILLAREIRKGGTVVTVRNARGFPVTAGRQGR